MTSRNPRTEPDASVPVSGSGSACSSDPDCPDFTIQYTRLMQNRCNNTSYRTQAARRQGGGQPCTATIGKHHPHPSSRPARDQVKRVLYEIFFLPCCFLQQKKIKHRFWCILCILFSLSLSILRLSACRFYGE